MLVPSSVISSAAASGATRQIQAATIKGSRPTRSCSRRGKSKRCKDAGRVRSQRLRARLRTRQRAALQRVREGEMGGRGPAQPPAEEGELVDVEIEPFLRDRDD